MARGGRRARLRVSASSGCSAATCFLCRRSRRLGRRISAVSSLRCDLVREREAESPLIRSGGGQGGWRVDWLGPQRQSSGKPGNCACIASGREEQVLARRCPRKAGKIFQGCPAVGIRFDCRAKAQVIGHEDSFRAPRDTECADSRKGDGQNPPPVASVVYNAASLLYAADGLGAFGTRSDRGGGKGMLGERRKHDSG